MAYTTQFGITLNLLVIFKTVILYLLQILIFKVFKTNNGKFKLNCEEFL